MTHAEKYADWRERHPQKFAAIQKAVAVQVGMRGGIKSELGQQTVDRMCQAFLAALLGWGKEPEPEPTDTPSAIRREARKVLDLEEIPLTGRDRATGERDD